MDSHTLVVEVVSANGLSDSHDLLNPCVELRFAGQSFTTSVKNRVRCPVWNETIYFNVLDKERLAFLTLEAYVYNVIDGSKFFLGKVRIYGSNFAVSPDEVVKDYQLKGGILKRLKGMLLLKVFLKDEGHVVTTDPLSAVIPFRYLREAVREPERFQPMDSRLKEIKPKFEHGLIVEHMPHIFVHVVKARQLPDVDASGRLDPYVVVKVGNYRGFTEYMHKEQNPEWNTTFAFSKLQMDCDHVTGIYVLVYDMDMVRGDFVGMVHFDVSKIPYRSPSEESLVSQWYRLSDASGQKTVAGELKLAVWRGSQADKAFPDAWKSDACHVDKYMLPHILPKVYDLPSLWYMRVQIIEFKCIAVAGGAQAVELYATAAVGVQNQSTRKVKRPLDHFVWNEDLMFVAAEPFEGDLQISVKAHEAGTDKVVGHIAISLEKIQRRIDNRPIVPQWFDLQISPEAEAVDGGYGLTVSACRIFLGNCLEGGYNARYDSMGHNEDLRPAAKEISNPPEVVGLLEIGILSANGLPPRERRNGEATLHPYCVAKYGRRWVRTRTIINSCNPVFNEQYTWDVYDTATVLTIGIFDNDQLVETSSNENRGASIGKVRIRLSNLQLDRLYAHSYPLLVLRPWGVQKMGELQLAVRFSPKSVVKMLRMYSTPMLPKMHYEHPLSVVCQDYLQYQAVQLLASQLSRMEPPLRKDVVEYMCDVSSQLWSMRKSKANFFRIMAVISVLIQLARWFENIRSWKNPATTLLAHAAFVVVLLFHEFILPSVLLYIFSITMWNYRWRPAYLPHLDTRVSDVEAAHPDDLDEEFDTFPTSRNFDLVRMRYDRLRSAAGRIQAIMGDLASYGEKIQALARWRDPTATAIFGLFTLAAAILLYFTPWKIPVAIAGFYTMRHPMLRRKRPMLSFLGNFYRRLPNMTDYLL